MLLSIVTFLSSSETAVESGTADVTDLAQAERIQQVIDSVSKTEKVSVRDAHIYEEACMRA